MRGGGVLPTLLVGSQPYGAAAGRPHQRPGRAGRARSQHVEELLATLQRNWARLLSPTLPRLDPEARRPRRPARASAAALVSQILGAVPHPHGVLAAARRRRARRLRARLGRDPALDAGGRGGAPQPDGTLDSIGTCPGDWRDTSHDAEFGSGMWWEWIALRSRLLEAATVDDQLVALEAVPRRPGALSRPAALRGPEASSTRRWERLRARDVIDLVQAHADRTEPISWLPGLVPGVSRMIGDADDPSACFAHAPVARGLRAAARGAGPHRRRRRRSAGLARAR